jgi:hypothetical protein
MAILLMAIVIILLMSIMTILLMNIVKCLLVIILLMPFGGYSINVYR